MIGFPKAKINLGLRITGKRDDGYHDIETIFYPVRFCDALEFVIQDDQIGKDSLITTGIKTGVDPEENLVIKAVHKLRENHDFPLLKIHLHKCIPVGAGLGGGSSDSACILKAVNKGFGLNTSDNELKIISLDLGSDCPFFIDSTPALGLSRGEVLESIPPVLKDYYIVLFLPGVAISTWEAYQNCKTHKQKARLKDLITLPLWQWKNLIFNDFEEFAFKKHPVISELKDELYKRGALFSLMSGSGSGVYGIFNEKPDLPENLKKYLIFGGKM